MKNRVCMMAENGWAFDMLLGQDGTAYKLVHCISVCNQNIQHLGCIQGTWVC